MKRQFSLAISLAVLLALPVAAQTPPPELPPEPTPATSTAGTAPSPDRPPLTMQPVPNDPEPPKPIQRIPKSSLGAAEAPATEDDDEGAITLKPRSHRCFVRDIMAFYDRTHVRCYNRARGKFNFFAVDTGQPVAETVLLKAWRSMRSGKPLTITYAPSSDVNPVNCAQSDCRRLLDVLN